MGLTDQRGDWRRVVTDEHRQAPGEGKASLEDEARGVTGDPGSEPRGIRLLTGGGGASRLHCGTAEMKGAGPDPSPIEASGQVERVQRLRGDEAHSPHRPAPQGSVGRGPGPLSARIASRQRRVSSAMTVVGADMALTRPRRAGDDPTASALAS